VLAQSWQTRGMLCPMALPIWANSWRNLLPSRASRNSHPAASRSTQHSPVDVGPGARLVSRSRKNQTHGPPLDRESGAQQRTTSDSTQHSAVVAVPSKGSDLWEIESFSGGLPLWQPRNSRKGFSLSLLDGV
jgi:hypothetical protein